MEIIEKALLVISLFTALVGVVAFMVKVYKFIRAWEKWVEEKDEHDKDNYMSIQQLKIMSPHMPLSERIKAGEKYINCGGNGEVKLIYNKLLQCAGREKGDNNCE